MRLVTMVGAARGCKLGKALRRLFLGCREKVEGVWGHANGEHSTQEADARLLQLLPGFDRIRTFWHKHRARLRRRNRYTQSTTGVNSNLCTRGVLVFWFHTPKAWKDMNCS